MTLEALALAAALVMSTGQTASNETSANLRNILIQGNLATSDDEVRRLAQIEIGMQLGPTIVEDVAARLRATKRFNRVEVRKRFASLTDPAAITLVIVVDEGPVRIELTGDPSQPTRVVRARGPHFLFSPVLDAEDGYGATYGARLALANPAGSNSRLSVPLTWGGRRQAGIELDKRFADAPVSRLSAGTSIDQRTNPFFDLADRRERLWLRAERSLTPRLRAGGTVEWQSVHFSSTSEGFARAGLDVTFDTRIDPVLARNAVYARVAWDRSGYRTAPANRASIDGRAYVGLFKQNVVVVRAMLDTSDASLPPYAKPLLGGMESLRGFRAGFAAGDTTATASAEALVLLTSPLSIGKLGLNAFTDLGTAYNRGQRLADQRWHQGIGAGVWFAAAFVRINVAVAHGLGVGTRLHVGGGVSF